MKKAFLSIIVIFSFLQISFAQYNSFPRLYDLRFGVHVSPAWSWFGSDNNKVSSVGSILGIKLGLIAENRFTENYSIVSGFNVYLSGGGKLRVDGPNKWWVNSYDQFSPSPSVADVFQSQSLYKYNLSWFEIPLGLKLRTLETANHIRYFAEPNVSMAFRYDTNGSTTGLGFGGKYDQDNINLKDESGGLYFSFGFGIGGEYIVANNTSLSVGLYYQKGLNDVTSDKNGVIYDAAGANPKTNDTRVTMSSLSLRLGVMF